MKILVAVSEVLLGDGQQGVDIHQWINKQDDLGLGELFPGFQF